MVVVIVDVAVLVVCITFYTEINWSESIKTTDQLKVLNMPRCVLWYRNCKRLLK